MLDVLLPSAVSAPSCGANQYVDSDGYCVACGDGTAGANPKDRTTCLCKSGWGFFSADHDGRCSALSRWLCFPFCMAMLPAAVREQGGTEPWASGLEPAHRWSQLPQPAEGLLLYLASCSENVPGWAVFVPYFYGYQQCLKCSSGTAGTAKDPTQCTCSKGYGKFNNSEGTCTKLGGWPCPLLSVCATALHCADSMSNGAGSAECMGAWVCGC
jgi:hypothetical protein